MKNSPRIAIVAASAPPYSSGGIATAHYNLFRALKKRGFNVTLFTFFDNSILNKKESHIIRNGAPIWLIKTLYFLAQLPFRILEPRKLGYQTGVIVRSLIGAIKMGRSISRFKPSIVILSDHGAPGLLISKNRGQKFILISHHNPARFAQEPLLGEYSKLDVRVAIAVENLVLRKVDHVICPSHYISRWFHSTYSFSRSVSIIPNLVELDFIDRVKTKDIRKVMHLPRSSRMIYLPSAGTRIKGSHFLPELIEGIFKIKTKRRVGLYIPGHLETETAAKLKGNRNFTRLYLPGQISYKKHVGMVKACDFGITPAVMENFSMAILEATYLGVPMLAFRRGGNEDIIENGKNGFLVPAFSIKKMVGISQRLIRIPRLTKFKRKSAAFTRQKFGSGTIVKKYLEVLGIEG